jgi:release factor glutamine methyltransferase
VLRTGAFFASRIDGKLVAPDAGVLDLGTGSGICALFAARHANRVVAVDINPDAVRCATVNALMNRLDARIAVRQGDLFAPVAGERFDLVLFNPPFIAGPPKDARDAAWRSSDLPQRFAAGLAAHLQRGGAALVLLSSFGDACPRYEAELRAAGFKLELFARRRYVNETVTILRATPARS